MKVWQRNIDVKVTWPGIKGNYEAVFKIDEEASISAAPRNELIKAGFRPEGKILVRSDDGNYYHQEYCLAVFEINGEMLSGRIVMGPDNIEPVLGWWILKDYLKLRKKG